MTLTWLHVSDFHLRAGDPYDRDKVLDAFVRSVRSYREKGRAPDLIFATGDIAHSGKPEEYEIATTFFDALLDAAGLERRHLFVVAGNHDVDRGPGRWMLRTLPTPKDADAYFVPGSDLPHLVGKQQAFLDWHDQYFEGIRSLPRDSTCGPLETIAVGGVTVAVLPLNTALFCQDSHDHEKLWVGRRCLSTAIDLLTELEADLRVALLHHPLEWPHASERPNIKGDLRTHVDLILRGHLHSPEVEEVGSVHGQALHFAAGAAYQGSEWPNCAFYCRLDGDSISVFPIRYEDQPKEIWTVHPSLFPDDPEYERAFPIPRLEPAGSSPTRPATPLPAEPPRPTRTGFPSNIPSRRNRPFVGRNDLLEEIRVRLDAVKAESALVLHGLSGTGKSELAREYARQSLDRYPGGTFLVDFSSGGDPLDLARLGTDHLGLFFPPDLPIPDQCRRALLELGDAPTLLIYDNVVAIESVEAWLPPAGMPCHVLITTTVESWGPTWPTLRVERLDPEASLDLIEGLAGAEVAARYGADLAEHAGGLPVQICPAAIALAIDHRRGRLTDARLELMSEATSSFRGPFERLEAPARLLLRAAARFNPHRIPRAELLQQLAEAASWTDSEFDRRLDECQSVHFLEGQEYLSIHERIVDFLRQEPVTSQIASTLTTLRELQWRRLVEIASEVLAQPADADLAAMLLAFPLQPKRWEVEDDHSPVSDDDLSTLGSALAEIARFEEARLWYERALEGPIQQEDRPVDHMKIGFISYEIGHLLSSTGKYDEAQAWFERAIQNEEQGDEHGCIDHVSLGKSLHQVGYCLSEKGEYANAKGWFERAAEQIQQGDIHGRIHHESLGTCLSQIGYCLLQEGEYEDAKGWYERAVEQKQQGDIHGRIDHLSLGNSLYQVGYWLLQKSEYEDARGWFERAAEHTQQGDIHGHIDHLSLGTILGEVGYCLLHEGKYDDARGWFERAIKHQQLGDIHGRIDHQNLGISLNRIGLCLSELDRREEALSWFERAIETKRRGDKFARIDHDSLILSLRRGARCARGLDRIGVAKAWEAEAAALDS